MKKTKIFSPLHRARCHIHFIKTNSCTYLKTHFHIHIKTLTLVKKMFCKKRHYKNPTCFSPYSMTIFRGRPSFLVHLLPFSSLLRHLSFLGMWPYAIYLYVCLVYLSVCCLVAFASCLFRSCFYRVRHLTLPILKVG
jgi:hypothetical protein